MAKSFVKLRYANVLCLFFVLYCVDAVNCIASLQSIQTYTYSKKEEEEVGGAAEKRRSEEMILYNLRFFEL